MGAANPSAEKLASACRDAVAEVTTHGALVGPARNVLVAAVRALAPAVPKDRPYGRRELYSAPEGEVMLARWRPFASSAPHDHGGSRGFVLVLDGMFEESTYRLEGRGLSVNPIREAIVWRRGEGIVVAARVVHAMTCLEGGTTVHVYSGTPGPFRVYDVDKRVTHVATGGAWLPPDRSSSVERWDDR